MRAAARRHSIFVPDTSITSFHFAASLRISAAICGGVPPRGMTPFDTGCSFTSAERSTALSSLLSRSITGCGVPAAMCGSWRVMLSVAICTWPVSSSDSAAPVPR